MNVKLPQRITAIGFGIIIAGLFYYQGLRGEFFLERAKANYIRVVPNEAIRGNIFDRKGVLLAYDTPLFGVAVIPCQISKYRDELFSEIATFLKIPRESIEHAYKDNVKSLFVPTEIISKIEKEKILALKEALGDDIVIKATPRRFYPFSYEVSHVLGYVKSASSFYNDLKVYGYTPFERAGFQGLEQYYDSYLKGKDGGELLEVDSAGRIVGFLGRKEPERGKNVTITIDIAMQRIAHQVLKGYRGVVILIDPTNGSIYVLVSSPAYDLNRIIEGVGLDAIFNDNDNIIFNRAIQFTYPLGSVFKPILAVAGMEEKIVSSNTMVNCDGVFMLGSYKFRCTRSHGRQDISGAIKHSCNVYFYNLGLSLGINKIAKWARRFGLGEVRGVDLPYENKGIVPDAYWKKKNKKSGWFKGDTVNTSIGQGYLEVTPLQAVVAMSVFANGGYIVKPHLLKGIDNLETGIVSRDYLGISPYILGVVKEALRSVVSSRDGTAHMLDDLNLDIAGKTGTVQNVGKHHGWFLGFFPYDDPQYSLCVLLENAGSSLEAEKVAYQFLKSLKENKIINGKP
ncbi:MAG: penicillin-binding protein 2 [Candidatus Omnitrophota bacterium]